MSETVWQTELPDLAAPKRGKVRDLYDLGDSLLLVACDRISAYDHVLNPGIPGKGKILNQLTNYWFDLFSDVVPNHLVATEPEDFPAHLHQYADQLRGRAVLVTKLDVVPFECVARGFLAGSAFKEYQQGGKTCGHDLPPGMKRADRLEEPLFTPATKAEDGHDENVDFEYLTSHVGAELAAKMRDLTLKLYSMGRDHAAERGMLLADTKFEFGLKGSGLVLIDEVLTPDSSRYWEADKWQPGEEPVSYDKQFVRNWLDDVGWDRESTPPELPQEVIDGTLERYIEAFRRITGKEPLI